ncbi:hypothetical protein IFM12275_16430 [Nocardia sputorum]|nr:hypothetical protein IFM12275_16430 [Nocardia sputorum]
MFDFGMCGALRGYASLPPPGLTAHAVSVVGMCGALRGYAALPPPGLTAHAVFDFGMCGALRGYAALPPPGLTAHAAPTRSVRGVSSCGGAGSGSVPALARQATTKQAT